MKTTTKTIFFMGANGFPTSTYQPILHRIQSKLSKLSLDGGQVSIKGIDIYQSATHCTNWKILKDDILHQIDHELSYNNSSSSQQQQIIGIGHSVGGALLTIAASHRPNLFQKLILIDSPYFHYKKRILWGIALKILPTSIAMELNTLVKKAKTKQDTWNTLQHAREYLKLRNVFRDMNDEIFESFISNCLISVPSSTSSSSSSSSPSPASSSSLNSSIKLLFPRDAEANLMLNVQIDIPFITNMERDSVGQYNIPPTLSGHFLYSNRHDFLDSNDIKYAQTIFPKSFQFHEYPHSHFWPLVDPENFCETLIPLILK